MAIGVVLHNPFGHSLEYSGLPGLGRGNDHCPLPFSERAEEVDDPVGVVRLPSIGSPTLQDQGFIGMLGAELGKERSPREILRRDSVDNRQVLQRGTLAVLRSIADSAGEFVSGSKVEFLDNPGADIDIIVPRSVSRFRAPDEA